MKRIVTAFTLALVMLFTGCSGGQTTELGLDKVVEKLVASGLFSDSLAENDPEMISGMLCLYDDSVTIPEGDIAKGYYYTTMGENADQIIAAECISDEAAENVLAAMKLYIGGMKESLEYYNPDEVEKMEGAVTLLKGKNVILAVAADENALSELVGDLA